MFMCPATVRPRRYCSPRQRWIRLLIGCVLWFVIPLQPVGMVLLHHSFSSLIRCRRPIHSRRSDSKCNVRESVGYTHIAVFAANSPISSHFVSKNDRACRLITDYWNYKDALTPYTRKYNSKSPWGTRGARAVECPRVNSTNQQR